MGVLLQTPAPLDSGGGVWPVVGGLLGFVAILTLAYFGLRVLSRKNLLGGRGRHLQVIDRVAAGRDSAVVLVRVASKVLILGATKESIRTLGELSAEELNLQQPDSAGAAPHTHMEDTSPRTPARKGFFRRFVHNMGVYSGVLPKGTPPARPGDSGKETATPPLPPQPSSATPSTPVSTPPSPQSPAPPSPLGAGKPSFRETLAATYGARSNKVAATPGGAPESTAFEPPSILARYPDYNEAIDRMKHFSRMQQAEKHASEPTATDNLAFVRAARAYADKVKSEGVGEDMDDLAERISRRTQRLARRLEAGGGKSLE